ncbi:MAG: PfkB family carbohydrate kinase, partial [Solirubrobacteraceae bacterium]|nr:PfkB family carbohydrate kinase [Solirubrobacteraceae bacterium]
GDDPWGRWLEEQLRAAGVDTTDFVLERGGVTPVVLVTVSGRGEPDYTVYGSTTGLGLVPAAERISRAVSQAGLVLLTSNTLLGEQERRLTMGARAQALAEGKKVVVDANLRPNRWADAAEMRRETLALLEGAFLAKMNAHEAEVLTGESDPVRAAEALRGDVARNVVITSGDRGAVLRGENGVSREVPSIPVVVRNAAGAGDAVTGVLLARLAASGGYAPSLNVALPEAMEKAAAVVQRWGAT